MGFYINPKDGSTKEDWLEEHGEPISRAEVLMIDKFDVVMPVVLIDNGFFTAAGIGYSKEEVEAFAENVRDTRPKKYYVVKVADLKPYL